MRNITDIDIMAAIARVEGQDYRIKIEEALIEWQASVESALDLAIEFNDEDCIDENESSSVVIYGFGGWSRYFVTLGGEVVFSRRHSENRPAAIARAKAQGFRIDF